MLPLIEVRGERALRYFLLGILLLCRRDKTAVTEGLEFVIENSN